MTDRPTRRILRELRYTLAGLPRPRQALCIDEGQVLVLNFDRLSAEMGDRIKARIRADAPGLTVLLVTADSIAARDAS